MYRFIRVALLSGILQGVAITAAAQQPAAPLEPRRVLAWGAVGFQGDLGGAVNESGIGVVGGQRAEINTNTWAERYDTALIFRVGGAYNVSGTSQVFGAMTWEQSEADAAVVGLISNGDLTAKFSDYQGWGFDIGYRYFPRTDFVFNPFVSASIGFNRIQDITLDLSSATFNATEIPFYDDSWVAGWRIGAGFLQDINDRFGWQVTLDFSYTGILSDQAGIGTVGFERINNGGSRWTLPIMAGAYVKF